MRKPAFKWVNPALGNIKAAIVGTYRSINSKHVPRYLAEFEQSPVPSMPTWVTSNPLSHATSAATPDAVAANDCTSLRT